MHSYITVVPIIVFAKWTEGIFSDGLADNQNEFVELYESIGDLKSKEVKSAMLQVDRKLYNHSTLYEEFPCDYPDLHTKDEDPPLNMQVLALETLKNHLKVGDRALDLASGSGYLATCMAYMVDEPGLVVGKLSTSEEFVNATRNVQTNNPEVLQKGVLRFVEGDITLGVPEYAPYDTIHIGEEMKAVPQSLLQQLNNGGRMMIPITNKSAIDVFIYDKHDNGTISHFLYKTLTLMKIIEYLPQY